MKIKVPSAFPSSTKNSQSGTFLMSIGIFHLLAG